MEGHSHALSGACAGLGAGILLHMTPLASFELAGFTAGMALLNDLDSCTATAARSLGVISWCVAFVIRAVTGGHRHGSHSLAAVGVFTGLAVLACHFRADWGGKAGLALLITIAVSSALEALHVTDGHTADVAAAAVAAGVIFLGFGLALIPLAVAVGTLTHLAGDGCTDSGVPLALPLSDYRFRIPEPFALTTGTAPETMIVDPVLSVAIVILAAWVIDPSLDRMAWAYVAHLAGRL